MLDNKPRRLLSTGLVTCVLPLGNHSGEVGQVVRRKPPQAFLLSTIIPEIPLVLSTNLLEFCPAEHGTQAHVRQMTCRFGQS